MAAALLDGFLDTCLFNWFDQIGGSVFDGSLVTLILKIGFVAGLLCTGYLLFMRRREKSLKNDEPGDAAFMPALMPSGEADDSGDQAEDGAASQDQEEELDPEAVKEMAQDIFFKFQKAWMQQDAALLQSLIDGHLFIVLSYDLENLKSRGQVNHLENVTLRQVEISEFWRENGLEYVTVGFWANLLDYVVDRQTCQVIAGSDSKPVKFEERWTFVRPCGSDPQAWKLTNIKQS
ncbi:MAG: TIM44-like domain-containing protein [Desulfobacteraceae bacterium]